MILQDGNAGLVKLVVDSQTRRRVQRLTDTYMTLPLGAIAQQVCVFIVPIFRFRRTVWWLSLGPIAQQVCGRGLGWAPGPGCEQLPSCFEGHRLVREKGTCSWAAAFFLGKDAARAGAVCCRWGWRGHGKQSWRCSGA